MVVVVPMKIIFLDVDYVLNYEFSKTRIDGYLFVEDSKIELLKQLIEHTEGKIVLSSTWRFGWVYMDAPVPENDAYRQREIRHFIALRDKLQEFGLELLDRTPVSAEDDRGKEIDEWLRKWDGEPIESFVILDDMNGKYLRPHSNRLIRTSARKGLEQKHVDLAVKILNKPYIEKT